MVRRPQLHRTDGPGPDGPQMGARSSGVDGRSADGRVAAAGTARGVKRFLVVVALLGSIQVIVMLGVEAHRAVEGQRAIARLQIDIRALEFEAAGLAAIVEHADDPVYREQLARRRGFIYPDEVRVVPLR